MAHHDLDRRTESSSHDSLNRRRVPRYRNCFHNESDVTSNEQKEDEVYYVLSGKGVMTLDDKPVDVGPGTAILTRPGSSHGLKQAGNEDLVIMIAYEVK